jgi:hypothetical protein
MKNLRYDLHHAQRVIFDTWGDRVNIKSKSLFKFGRNTDLGTSEETVWVRGGIETYATGNTINQVSSSDNSDTQEIKIEGHTISGSELSFVSQTITLTGQTPVTLTTPLYRASRLFNNDNTDFAGEVYGYESGGTVTAGVPQDATKIHVEASGATNQSLKASTSISNSEYWIITSGIFSVNRTQTRTVDFKIKIREFGKVFRVISPIITVQSTQGTIEVIFNPPLIVPKNSDIIINAISSGTGTTVDAGLNGYLAIVR